jgi:hypothetical protein
VPYNPSPDIAMNPNVNLKADPELDSKDVWVHNPEVLVKNDRNIPLLPGMIVPSSVL